MKINKRFEVGKKYFSIGDVPYTIEILERTEKEVKIYIIEKDLEQTKEIKVFDGEEIFLLFKYCTQINDPMICSTNIL